ncbi:hypothetical protein [Pseudoxanthomonas sp. UTMC 1351]|uniref:hypothetical protein n=1 Tax=Pseudoxanthomonas sp. UTMC 1351 TaxID=2695853 RepID=UPI0034CE29A0
MPAIGCGIGVAFGLQVPRSGPAGFDPAQLFENGEPGAWYDPSDLSTLFQDAAGTVPVTASGQPVRLMRDKSGHGNDLTLTNAALNDAGGLRSIVFNGFSASGVSGSIDFTGTNQVTVWAGLRKISDGSAGTVVELSPGPANSGIFTLSGPGTANVANYAFRSQGTTPRFATTAANFPAVTRNVVTGIGDIAGNSVAIRVSPLKACD